MQKINTKELNWDVKEGELNALLQFILIILPILIRTLAINPNLISADFHSKPLQLPLP